MVGGSSAKARSGSGRSLLLAQPATKWLTAFLLLMLYVGLLVVASQLSSIAFLTSHFKAPFLFVMFKMITRASTFPIYLLINALIQRIKGCPVNLPATIRFVPSLVRQPPSATHCVENASLLLQPFFSRLLGWK